MGWNRVDLKKKDKNLPPIDKRVLWVNNDCTGYIILGNSIYYQFIGKVTEDFKYIISDGGDWYKLTSNFWWRELPKNPDKLECVYAVQIISVKDSYNSIAVSKEVYDSYDKAKNFIENKSSVENLQQIDEYNWESDKNRYSIFILNVV